MIINTIIIFIFSFLFGFLYRSFLKQFKSKKIQVRAKRNINKRDRYIRAGLGVFLLVWGLFSGSQILVFAAGFCFFEAIFSWCGFNALIGKNTCELE